MLRDPKLFPYFKNIDSDFMKLKVDIVQKILDITLFLVQLKSILSNQVLRKLVKLASSLNVKNSFISIFQSTQGLALWVLFLYGFLKKF